MGFYDLPKTERAKIVEEMKKRIRGDLMRGTDRHIREYAVDPDTYIRRNTYLILGKLYHHTPELREKIFAALQRLFSDPDARARQTAVYGLGEIGKLEAERVLERLQTALRDPHHSVRNAVVGALKQMGAKNPLPTLQFARQLLHHPDPEIRRRIVHGIELRGRTHPEEILPLLGELQHDPDREVRRILVHVLGQISYKSGCLEKVVYSLKSWTNKPLVENALNEILDVHRRYQNFSAKSYREARDFIAREFRR